VHAEHLFRADRGRLSPAATARRSSPRRAPYPTVMVTESNRRCFRLDTGL
jgi:hypothetical protein